MNPTDYQHSLTARQRCDVELLLNGGFAPLDGFLTRLDYESVLTAMRLANGQLWPIPIVLDISLSLAQRLTESTTLILQSEDGSPLAQLQVAEVYAADFEAEARMVYGSTDRRHPGVAEVYDRQPWYVGGRVEMISAQTWAIAGMTDFPVEYRTPAQLRESYPRHVPIVAFQTRNPLHHAHIAVTKAALAQAGTDAKLLLHPAIGPTKAGDVDAIYRMQAYRAIRDYYEPEQMILAAIPLAMRMAGPREALWHAMIRHNHGASHFVVGRGHADPGGISGDLFYPPFAAQALLAAHRDEIGITPLFVPEYGYAARLQRYISADEAPDEPLEHISGTELRRRLVSGDAIPDWFSPPEVVNILRRAYPATEQRGVVVWFTGLSASGKTTLAKALLQRLEAADSRRVTMLDGDVVRRFLSKGLGFTQADRDENIRRIGFVASLVSRHGGIAIVSAISPYRSVRDEVRALVVDSGGLFVEVHVATPLTTCISRDPKGLYAQALAGEIKGFTGIDDPYEAPEHAELTIDTGAIDVGMAIRHILDYMGVKDAS